MEVNSVIKSYKGDEAKYITIADNAKDLLEAKVINGCSLKQIWKNLTN